MNSDLVTILATVIGSGGAGVLFTALIQWFKNRNESKIDEFTAIKTGMQELLAEHKEALRIAKEELKESRQEHEEAEAFIKSVEIGVNEGTIPPFPPRFLNP